MQAQEYIISALNELAKPTPMEDIGDTPLEEAIFQKVMSKKFRKYSVPQVNKSTILKHIAEQIRKNEPIKIFFPFGGYKLWRLEESPEADWAELFSVMYYTKWLKPICALYQPGVHFEFRLDEVVVEKLNNIPEIETRAYCKSFEKVLNYVATFAPKNIQFNVYLERSRYENYEAFERELSIEVETLRKERSKNPIPLTAPELASIDLNVRLKPGQADDPNWQKENDLIHIAYYNLQRHKKHEKKHYHDEGIVAFTVMFGAENMLAVGTTKATIAKFWTGVGVLKRKGESYAELVLSPNQLSNATFNWENVNLEGLTGKNFKKIRILS